MIIPKRLPSRRGAVKGFIAVFLLIIALLAGFFLNGSLNQGKQSTLLENGFSLFSKGDHAGALESFSEAKSTFSITLSFYRLLSKSEKHVSRTELSDLIISTCLSASHDNFFELKTAQDWIEKAREEVKNVSDSTKKAEYNQLIKTASDISALCTDFASNKVEKALKDLKKVENEALPADQDFFIFEIRFLIACGKALGEPAILNQARELLFFATTDAGIKNERTQKLWGILTN